MPRRGAMETPPGDAPAAAGSEAARPACWISAIVCRRCQIASHWDHWPLAGGTWGVLSSRSGMTGLNSSLMRPVSSAAVKKWISSPVLGPSRYRMVKPPSPASSVRSCRCRISVPVALTRTQSRPPGATCAAAPVRCRCARPRLPCWKTWMPMTSSNSADGRRASMPPTTSLAVPGMRSRSWAMAREEMSSPMRSSPAPLRGTRLRPLPQPIYSPPRRFADLAAPTMSRVKPTGGSSR